ncbi:hypothetical protein BC832DRAFT_592687 [Gaertneriomyces semiglobifer]|nr:hypothetical protein BC832DRAFT_592687 [Gaertneriomyces semiglobifer]
MPLSNFTSHDDHNGDVECQLIELYETDSVYSDITIASSDGDAQTACQQLLFTREKFLSMIFLDTSTYRKFLTFLQARRLHHFTDILQFHNSYTHLARLLFSRRLSLSPSRPSYATLRFLSPQSPAAPLLCLPAYLATEFNRLWRQYRGTVAHFVDGTVWRGADEALKRESVWCGVLDEVVAGALESIYQHAFWKFVQTINATDEPSPPAGTAGLLPKSKIRRSVAYSSYTPSVASTTSVSAYTVRTASMDGLSGHFPMRSSSLRPPSWLKNSQANSVSVLPRDSGISVSSHISHPERRISVSSGVFKQARTESERAKKAFGLFG